MADKEKIKYKCDWPGCGYEFEAFAVTSSGEKHSIVTTQIVCPRCGNGLPTYPEAKKK
jgi:DNA-directed RNA polymerase subunit RPC12/RpoP